MIDFLQVAKGRGEQGPQPDGFRPWDTAAGRDIEQIKRLALHRFLRESGELARRHIHALFVTVWHYDNTAPTHPNGRPMTVTATTYKIDR